MVSVLSVGDVEFTDNGDGTYTYIQPAESVIITVTFADVPTEPEQPVNNSFLFFLMLMRKEYVITAEASEGGTITPDGAAAVRYNQSLTYTITAGEGYEIADVLVDGESVGALCEYTFKRIRKNHSIEVIFTELP